jgi:dTDP-4-dehydrorhamnose reductase
MAARGAELDESLIRARPHTELGLTARRPRYAALSSERGYLMPPLQVALAAYLSERPWRRADDDALAMSAQDAAD